MSQIHQFANPTRFMRLSESVLPWSAGAAIVLFAVGIYLGLFVAPPDYQQGETVRIMYVHVPAATMASAVYALMAAASAVALIWKHQLAQVLARAAAPIGAMFTLIALFTGALWGKPTWGTWWVWDARLTSVLVMLFLYLGYIGLHQSFEDRRRGAKAAAILAVVGAINLPIIKFSVDWWHTLHQGASIIKLEGPSIHPDILIPLLFMWAGFISYFITILLMRMRRELVTRKIRALQTAVATGTIEV